MIPNLFFPASTPGIPAFPVPLAVDSIEGSNNVTRSNNVTDNGSVNVIGRLIVDPNGSLGCFPQSKTMLVLGVKWKIFQF